MQAASRSPVSVVLDDAGDPLIRAEARFETEKLAEDDERVLQRAMMLFAAGPLPLPDKGLRKADGVDPLNEETAEAFSRGVEPGGVVEAAGQREDLIRCDGD